MGVAHCDDYRKTAIWVGHLKVSDEDVKALRNDVSQSVGQIRGSNDLKSLEFKRLGHHGANLIFVIHNQDSMCNLAVGSHTNTASRHEL
jgi:hypothetical protein